MNSGIYHVQFRASTQNVGEGLLVLDDGRVNGGDEAYIFQGRLDTDGNKLSGTIRVSKWSNSMPSVFPGLDNYELEVMGQLGENGETLTAEGRVKQQPGLTLGIAGRRLAPLA